MGERGLGFFADRIFAESPRIRKRERGGRGGGARERGGPGGGGKRRVAEETNCRACKSELGFRYFLTFLIIKKYFSAFFL